MKFDNWKTVVIVGIGILAITGLEVVELSKGIDGIMLGTVIAAIAALASGVGVKVWDERKKK